MENISKSILFQNISRSKLEYFYQKYKTCVIKLDMFEKITDKDEILYCYYLMKNQQKREIDELSNLISSLNF